MFLEVNVKAQMDLLVKLQQKDQTLDILRRQMQEGPQRMAEIEKQVDFLEQDLETDKQQIEEVQKAQRQYEAEVEDGLGHINRSKGRLLTIKSNKEYQACLKEIEEGEKGNREKEDKILGCMEEIERLRQVLKEKGEDLQDQRQRFGEEKKTIEAKMGQAQEELSREEKERSEMLKAIDPGVLARYEQIKRRSGGLAVVNVKNTTCLGCHLNIPPQMYNELQRRDSLKYCPHCDRIIYWKDQDALQEANMSE
jgi:predicted  nucleic acid-binding Zn-ribbon protein